MPPPPPMHVSRSLSLCVWLTLPFLQSPQGHKRRGTNGVSGRAELGAVGQLQAEMLHLDLIDDADGFRGDIESSKPSSLAAPVLIKDPAGPVTMDTYRPKRPTTLNLFPIVPRTQVRLDHPHKLQVIDLINRCVRDSFSFFGSVFECLIQFKCDIRNGKYEWTVWPHCGMWLQSLLWPDVCWTKQKYQLSRPRDRGCCFFPSGVDLCPLELVTEI